MRVASSSVIEDRGSWRQGLFDDLYCLRQTIDELSGGGNLYITINAPKMMAATNTMRVPRYATTTSPSSCDCRSTSTRYVRRTWGAPRTELGELSMHGIASSRRSRPSAGPRRRRGIGNGAHALYRSPVAGGSGERDHLADTVSWLAPGILLRFVLFDSTVWNASRIWRLYGTRIERASQHPNGRIAWGRSVSRHGGRQSRQRNCEPLRRVRRTRAAHAPITTPAVRRRRRAPATTALDIVGWFAAHVPTSAKSAAEACG